MSELTPEFTKDLTYFAASHKMSIEEMAQCMAMITERENILKKHKIPITQGTGKDRRWKTRLPDGRQYAKTKLEDLEDVIIEYYTSHQSTSIQTTPQSTDSQKINDCTLKKLYPEWLKNRKYEVSENTLAYDIRNWNTYIANSEIADIPLQQIGRKHLIAWAKNIITEYSMKKRYFSNVRCVLNSMFKYAVDEELLDINRLEGIKINNHLFVSPKIKMEQEEVFTEQEQKQVMEEAELDSNETQSAIPLGIPLLFLTGMRVGELCALTYDCIEGNYLYIHRMVIEKKKEAPDGTLKSNGYQIVEHAKSSAGARKIFLTTDAQKYLSRIKELNKKNGYGTSGKDLIFQRKGTLCNQEVFDCKIKKYCNQHHLNLKFAKSCHDIRRTYISHLFDLGTLNPDEIRRIAGHENIEMTMRYCQGRKDNEEIARILENGFSA